MLEIQGLVKEEGKTWSRFHAPSAMLVMHTERLPP